MVIQRIRNFLHRVRRDKQGAAAIEFAFIAPILFILYFMTGEISQAIEANTKVGRIANMVGDLVGQETKVEPSYLDGIMGIGAAIIQPYGRSQPTIVIEHIKIEDKTNNPKAHITWSRKLENGATKRGTNGETTVPDELRVRDTYLIRVTTQLNYRPIITWTVEQKASLGLLSAFDSINMSERYYLRSRMSNVGIECIGC